MTFTLPVQTSVTQVNLLFYNNPSIGVGLPNIDGLFWDTANPYLQSSDQYFTIAGNQDLSQRDAGLHNISLIIASNVTVLPYAFLRIHFSFPSTILVRTLLLSEVQLSNTAGNHPSYVADMSRLLPSFIPTVSPPLTTNISFLPHPSVVTIEPVASQSSYIYNISCTVVNEGSFEWKWILPTSIPYQIWVGDGTRTSVLQLSHISSDYSGNYVCLVRYKSQTSFVANSTVTLQVKSKSYK